MVRTDRGACHRPAFCHRVPALAGRGPDDPGDWIEQGYKQVKDQLGLADFQVRSDIGIRRHQALVNAAFSFCWDAWFADNPPQQDPAAPRPRPAAGYLQKALGIFRDLGDQPGQANALRILGNVWRLTGDYVGAAQDLEEALGICRDLGNRGGEVEALNEAGTLHRVCDDLRQAGSYHQQALDLARQIASAWDEAHALAGLGRCAVAAGHATQAEVLLRQALEIFQRIGAAEAPGMQAELDALT